MSNLTGRGNSHVYYNISVTNNDTSDSSAEPPVVSFTETRNQAFLNCPEDYHMSVVRFNLETPTLPILQVQPLLGAADKNITVYDLYLSRTIGAGGTAVTTNTKRTVMFTPSNTLAATPVVPITSDAYILPYYNVYSHNAFINMINTAFSQAYNDLYTSSPPANAVAPYLYWDVGSSTAILNISQSLANPGVDMISIYFNAPLYNLFSSFPASFVSNPFYSLNIPSYKLTIDTGLNANLSASTVTTGTPPTTITTTIYTYQILQEYPTGPLWTPIESIVFTTSLIPVIPELVASPIIYDNNGFASVGGNANITTTLTDFIIPMSTGNEYKPSINYTPTGEYRLSTLFGKQPIHSIQVNVFYKDRYGNLIPITLGSGCTGSLKILFRRRDFSNIILD